MLAWLSPAWADGVGQLGLLTEENGRVDFVTVYQELTPSGTLVVSGIPATATIRQAYFYYGTTLSTDPTAASFEGNPLSVTSIGAESASVSFTRAFRNDVTAWVVGDGSYSYSVTSPSNPITTLNGVALIVIYEDSSSILLDHQIVFHDGVHAGNPTVEPTTCPWPNPVTFAGLATSAATTEAQVAYLANNGTTFDTEEYLFNGVTIATPDPSNERFEWDRFDVTPHIAPGATSATANLCELTGSVAWNAAVLRVRTEGEDTDGDGVEDLVDICPNDPDPSQTDTDGDGLGDACDACRFLADPTDACVPDSLTIRYEVIDVDFEVGEGIFFPDPTGSSLTVRYAAAGPATIASSGSFTVVSADPALSGAAVGETGALPGVVGAFTGYVPNSPFFPTHYTLGYLFYDEALQAGLSGFNRTGTAGTPFFPCSAGTGVTDTLRWNAEPYTAHPSGHRLSRSFVNGFGPGQCALRDVRVMNIQEIDRIYVPEPALGLGLLAGIGVLTGLGRVGRIRPPARRRSS
jgi:hypothetical protein